MALLVGSLIRSYCTKMTNSFTKKILIVQAELDRLQQRQLRDYSPELQAMVRLLNDIRDIIFLEHTYLHQIPYIQQHAFEEFL